MKKFAYMYGFKKDKPEIVGWLGISRYVGYVIMEDRENALRFGFKNTTPKTKGWASPEKWLKFFGEEPELANWKFHIVKITE